MAITAVDPQTVEKLLSSARPAPAGPKAPAKAPAALPEWLDIDTARVLHVDVVLTQLLDGLRAEKTLSDKMVTSLRKAIDQLMVQLREAVPEETRASLDALLSPLSASGPKALRIRTAATVAFCDGLLTTHRVMSSNPHLAPRPAEAPTEELPARETSTGHYL